jgi:hypothetical protein
MTANERRRRRNICNSQLEPAKIELAQIGTHGQQFQIQSKHGLTLQQVAIATFVECINGTNVQQLKCNLSDSWLKAKEAVTKVLRLTRND